jgi:hypothetical protein
MNVHLKLASALKRRNAGFDRSPAIFYSDGIRNHADCWTVLIENPGYYLGK